MLLPQLIFTDTVPTTLSWSMTGGVSAAGDAAIAFNPYEVTTSGGAAVAGDAAIELPSVDVYAIVVGSTLGADVALLFAGIDSYDMLGGVSFSADVAWEFQRPSTYEEGVQAGFLIGADVIYEFDGTVDIGASVGAAFSLEFFTPAVYTVSAEGGVEWGGAATVQEQLPHIPTGGFVFGSGAQIQEALPYIPTGGAVWGGAATATITYAPSVSGGFVYAGSAPISAVYSIETPTGGFVFGGDAAEADFSAWHAPSGGFTWSGAATAYAQTAVYTASTENPTNDPYYAWSINAENQAVSRYVRFFANSMAQFGGKTYVSNAGGIYEVGADDDAGQPIRASVLFPKTDFSESRTKRMEVAYLGAVTEGKLRLKMMANEDEPRYYAALPQGDSAKGAIVRIGKGMAGRYWTMRLDNVDGCDFELDSAEFKPIPSRTRHGA